MMPGMLQFPTLVPPTVDHSDDWVILHNDESLLAQEEAELEEKVQDGSITLATICLSLYSLFACQVLQDWSCQEG
jgi:hypothetical protein